MPLHSKLLIEIAIVNFASPSHANGIAAHQPLQRRGIKIVNQQLHIFRQLVIVSQIGGEARDRKVGDGVKFVENNPEMSTQLAFVIGFELGLRWRQKCADWIVDQVQRQSSAVSERI